MPVKSVQEFVGYAKANPGKVNFSLARVAEDLLQLHRALRHETVRIGETHRRKHMYVAITGVDRQRLNGSANGIFRLYGILRL